MQTFIKVRLNITKSGQTCLCLTSEVTQKSAKMSKWFGFKYLCFSWKATLWILGSYTALFELILAWPAGSLNVHTLTAICSFIHSFYVVSSSLCIVIWIGSIVTFKQRWMQNTDCHRCTGKRAVHLHSPDKGRQIPFCLPAWLSHSRQHGEDGNVVARGSRWLPASLSFSSPLLILLPPVEEDARTHLSSCAPSLQNAGRRSCVLNGTGYLQLKSVRCLFFLFLHNTQSHTCIQHITTCCLTEWVKVTVTHDGISILNIYI